MEDLAIPFGITITHWVLYNIPSARSDLPEGIPKDSAWEGIYQGRRSGRSYGYLGPCPPGSKAHRYRFRLYALSAPLDLGPGSSRKEVLRIMSGRIIATAELVGIYR